MQRHPERGSLALFGIMMAVVFMTVGGISIELWNVIGQRRQLGSVADSAAAAGATAIDPDIYRTNGLLILVPDGAYQRASESLSRAEVEANNAQFRIVVTEDLVSIEADGEVNLIILDLIGADPLRISVLATASPFQGN